MDIEKLCCVIPEGDLSRTCQIPAEVSIDGTDCCLQHMMTLTADKKEHVIIQIEKPRCDGNWKEEYKGKKFPWGYCHDWGCFHCEHSPRNVGVSVGKMFIDSNLVK